MTVKWGIVTRRSEGMKYFFYIVTYSKIEILTQLNMKSRNLWFGILFRILCSIIEKNKVVMRIMPIFLSNP